MLWLYEKVRKTLVTVFVGKWFMAIETVRGLSILMLFLVIQATLFLVILAQEVQGCTKISYAGGKHLLNILVSSEEFRLSSKLEFRFEPALILSAPVCPKSRRKVVCMSSDDDNGRSNSDHSLSVSFFRYSIRHLCKFSLIFSAILRGR